MSLEAGRTSLAIHGAMLVPSEILGLSGKGLRILAGVVGELAAAPISQISDFFTLQPHSELLVRLAELEREHRIKGQR